MFMIKIAGNVQRSFVFPADAPTAFEFYANMQRTLSMLTHISIVKQFSDSAYRMLYHTLELGLYRVHIYCDIQAVEDRQNQILRILPYPNQPPPPLEVGIYHLAAPGYYSSESVFRSSNGKTRIDYTLALNAQLPVPYGIRIMPDMLLNRLAHTISQHRIQEIASGFIEKSVEAFTG